MPDKSPDDLLREVTREVKEALRSVENAAHWGDGRQSAVDSFDYALARALEVARKVGEIRAIERALATADSDGWVDSEATKQERDRLLRELEEMK